MIMAGTFHAWPIAAFYAIVNIPEESLPPVFREMQRVCNRAGVVSK